eukprot:COSAG06_NODE_26621_length_610_cov_2.156556_1_plen_62_part_00
MLLSRNGQCRYADPVYCMFTLLLLLLLLPLPLPLLPLPLLLLLLLLLLLGVRAMSRDIHAL